MPTYRITVTNRTFTACEDHDLPSADVAGRQGIKAALAIGAEEVAEGTSFFAAEVMVENGDMTAERFIVSIGSSPIQ